jgi:restriction system protein
MTYLDAARIILQAAGQPLHYKEIAERALAQSLITPLGLTPDATMGSRLYTDTQQEGSLFLRAGHGRFGLVQWQPKGIDAHVEEINAGTRSQLAQLLEAMDPERFEALIRELLIQMGFDESTVEVTPYRADGGIDVTGTYRAAGLTQVSAAVQVKRWKANVGAKVVRELRGSLQVNQQGIIITTSDFARAARDDAAAPNRTRIGLINGDELLDLLIRHRVGVVERTLRVIDLDQEYWGELLRQTAPPAPADEPPPEPEPDEEAPASPRHSLAGFTLFNHEYPATTWRGLLLTVCQVLAERHGADFAPAAFSVRGKVRQYVAPDPEGMIDPAPIPGTGLWLEANQSGPSALRVACRLLLALGHDDATLVVRVE